MDFEPMSRRFGSFFALIQVSIHYCCLLFSSLFLFPFFTFLRSVNSKFMPKSNIEHWDRNSKFSVFELFANAVVL